MLNASREEQCSSEKMIGPIVFVGLEAISRAVGAGPGTVKRWIRDEKFPARRCSDGIYRADSFAIRKWFQPAEEKSIQ